MKDLSYELSNYESLIPDRLIDTSDDIAVLLKAYYEFLNVDGNASDVIANTKHRNGIDEAVDNFLADLQNELGDGFVDYFQADKENVYRHINDFYLAKGSVDSFKYLFRVLFNENVEVYLPSKQVFKASSATWIRTNVFRVDFTESDFNAFMALFAGNNTVLGTLSNADGQEYTVTINDYRVIDSAEYSVELYVDRNQLNSFTLNFTAIKIGDAVVAALEPLLSRYEINNAGFGFSIGQRYRVIQGDAHDAVIEISKVDNKGSITGIKFDPYGTGYDDPVVVILDPDLSGVSVYDENLDVDAFNDIVSPITDTLLITQTDYYVAEGYIDDGYFVGEGLPVRTVTDVHTNPDGDDVIGTKLRFTDYVGRVSDTFEALCGTPTPEVIRTETGVWLQDRYKYLIYETGGLARITLTNASFVETDGFFIGKQGFLSDESYLQDNYFYQAFSYVLASNKQRKDYESAVYKTAHPAGTKLFGQFNVDIELDVSGSGLAEIDRYDYEPQPILFGTTDTIGTISDTLTITGDLAYAASDWDAEEYTYTAGTLVEKTDTHSS